MTRCDLKRIRRVEFALGGAAILHREIVTLVGIPNAERHIYENTGLAHRTYVLLCFASDLYHRITNTDEGVSETDLVALEHRVATMQDRIALHKVETYDRTGSREVLEQTSRYYDKHGVRFMGTR